MYKDVLRDRVFMPFVKKKKKRNKKIGCRSFYQNVIPFILIKIICLPKKTVDVFKINKRLKLKLLKMLYIRDLFGDKTSNYRIITVVRIDNIFPMEIIRNYYLLFFFFKVEPSEEYNFPSYEKKVVQETNVDNQCLLNHYVALKFL